MSFTTTEITRRNSTVSHQADGQMELSVWIKCYGRTMEIFSTESRFLAVMKDRQARLAGWLVRRFCCTRRPSSSLPAIRRTLSLMSPSESHFLYQLGTAAVVTPATHGSIPLIPYYGSCRGRLILSSVGLPAWPTGLFSTRAANTRTLCLCSLAAIDKSKVEQ